MNNDERIKRWREQRRSKPAEDMLDVGDDFASASRSAPRSERLEAAPGAAPRPGEISLEEAREAIRRRQQEKWRKIVRRLALFLGAPLLAILAYVSLIATPLYQAEAVFTVQTSSQTPQVGSAGLFGLGSGNGAIADAFKTREFVVSRAMMNHMQQRHGFLSHFEAAEMDPLQRLNGPFGLNDDAYDYYRKRVRVGIDVQEGILRLYVQARTPEAAERFGRAILAAAERHVNEFSEKITADQIDALTRDVQSAEREVADARRSLAVVQARRGDLNPAQTATAIYQLVSSLELQLAEAERERNALLDQGLTNSPLLPRLTSRVEELRSQISEQRNRLANPGGGSLIRTVSEFERATGRKEIAEARYETTLKTLQQAYLRVLEERRYFVVVVAMVASATPAVRDIVAIAWPILLLLALAFALYRVLKHRLPEDSRFRASRFGETIDRWRRR